MTFLHRPPALFSLLSLLGLCVTLAGCGGRDPSSVNPVGPSPILGAIQSVAAPPARLLGAGDIAHCDAGAETTARLLDRLDGTVFTTGDNAYWSGSEEEFRRCYEPTWGRHRARTRPVPGNHEYLTPNAAGYFAYFGANAGPPGVGYYSYTLGSWQILALSSEIPVSAGSAQVQWLQAQLARRTPCTAVIFHRPLFTSGPNGPNPDLRELWRVLYEGDVDLVLNGHDHLYERFAPQDPDGRPDPVRGIRQFTVGSGGAPVYASVTRTAFNSEVRASVWGVASFTLDAGRYRWEFIPADGFGFTDSGIGECH
jgi:acid phosphatase type 7